MWGQGGAYVGRGGGGSFQGEGRPLRGAGREGVGWERKWERKNGA